MKLDERWPQLVPLRSDWSGTDGKLAIGWRYITRSYVTLRRG